MLKRAAKGERFLNIDKNAQRVLREYQEAKGSEITQRNWDTLAVRRCLYYEEYENRLSRGATHCVECDDIKIDGYAWKKSTHTVGMFGPEGRRSVCSRCGEIQEDREAHRCYCLIKILPLLETIRQGGTWVSSQRQNTEVLPTHASSF